MITKSPRKIYKSLYLQVIIAILIGIVLGHYYPETAVKLKPLGDGFIKLIKMLIGPVIFCTIVTGISGMQDLKKVGTVGAKALLYFEILTTVALFIGLVAINILEPGKGMNIDVSKLDTTALNNMTGTKQTHSVTEFLTNIIPTTPVEAFAQGDLLQILLFSVLFGIAASKLGPRIQPVTNFIKGFSDILFVIIHIIMKLAPLGALG
ncbi:MAG TPA: cation:dicarboxylase symporter family transporter, partial [Chitinophagaceae bacterium]|nr:cation:dicarboxylase symporter family transporter [Chitinophagaceae bacterium]